MTRTLIFFLISLVTTAPVLANPALAKTRNCLACHAVEKKLVGPSFQNVAIRYAGQDDAINKLTTKIIQGGSGSWGPVPMPANPHVSKEDAKQLATWIMSLQHPLQKPVESF